jgi:hypothetical protein
MNYYECIFYVIFALLLVLTANLSNRFAFSLGEEDGSLGLPIFLFMSVVFVLCPLGCIIGQYKLAISNLMTVVLFAIAAIIGLIVGICRLRNRPLC